jgi:hypothetical protein
VELLVGTIRTHGIAMPDLWMVVRHTKALGQELFEPPSVAGWPSGSEWIDRNFLQLRKKSLEKLWLEKENETDVKLSASQDLMVRLGAHVAFADDAVRYQIIANGRVLKDGHIRNPMITYNAVDAATGIPFETVVVSRALLPKPLNTVEVKLLPNKPGEQIPVTTGLFVNWVEHAGRRLSVNEAKPSWSEATACGQLGMMYCPSSMAFDFRSLHDGANRVAASLRDRNLGLMMEEVDRATVRLPLRLSPAGVTKDAAKNSTDGASGFEALFKASPASWTTALLPKPPLSKAAYEAVAVEQIKRIVLDPVYNLK